MNISNVVTRSNNRRFLDFRTIATSAFSIVLGAAMWKVQSLISGNPTFDPDFFAQLGWFVFVGMITGMIDPRSPWVNWMSLYVGTYMLALPFFPPDPLIPLALIVGAFLTGICVAIGTFIPSSIAYLFPFRNPALRRWAGYIE